MPGQRIKSLLITPQFLPTIGGVPKVYDAMAARMGGAMTILTASHDHVSGKEILGWQDSDASHEYPVIRIPFLRPLKSRDRGYFAQAMQFLKHQKFERDLLKQLVEISTGFDVIIIGSLEGLGWAVEPLKRLTGKPVLLYAHGEEVATRAYSSRARTRRRNAIAAADHIIAVSKFTKNLIVRRHDCNDSCITVINNGVDVKAFDRTFASNVRPLFQLPAEGPLVLSVGRLIERKGFDKLIEAWSDVERTINEANLLIVGDGPLKPELKKRLPEGARVHFIDRVSDEALRALYKTADLFVMPNRNLASGEAEGFGLVFLEAAAAGVPSIGGLSGGSRDAIVDGQTGQLVVGHDEHAISAAIIALLANRTRRATMGKAARAFAEKMTWDSKAEELSALLAKVMAEKA